MGGRPSRSGGQGQRRCVGGALRGRESCGARVAGRSAESSDRGGTRREAGSGERGERRRSRRTTGGEARGRRRGEATRYRGGAERGRGARGGREPGPGRAQGYTAKGRARRTVHRREREREAAECGDDATTEADGRAMTSVGERGAALRPVVRRSCGVGAVARAAGVARRRRRGRAGRPSIPLSPC